MPARILVAESDDTTRSFLADTLKGVGYEVEAISAGDEVLRQLTQVSFDLLFLDLNLPSESGIDLLRLVRDQNPEIRIILVSNRRSFEAAVKGLHYQISDFLVKPLTSGKVISSIARALTTTFAPRITESQAEYLTSENQVIIRSDNIRIDFSRRLIEWPGNEVHLTPSEARLLRILMENPGQPLTNSEILQRSQGYEVSQEEASLMLRPLISRLRRKLSRIPSGEKWITNVRGIGYVYERREKG